MIERILSIFLSCPLKVKTYASDLFYPSNIIIPSIKLKAVEMPILPKTAELGFNIIRWTIPKMYSITLHNFL